MENPLTSDYSELQQFLRVLVKDFSFDGFVRRKPPNRGDDLRAQTFWTGPNRILAIAAEHQFVLMPFQKAGREILVAGQRIQTGAGRAIAEHVRVIAQQPVRDAAGRHFAIWIRHFLVVVFVDVAPPGLRVADELNTVKFRPALVEPRDTA